jgi:hypothetical protein
MKVISLKQEKARIEKERYARLVMTAYDCLEHAEKREYLDRRTEIEAKAKERL